MSEQPIDILLAQRFVPEFGGSIRWMHEVYRRWAWPVEVITHDYYGHPPGTPEFPDAPARPPDGDHVRDANLLMDRRDILLRDWGLEGADRIRRYLGMTRAVGERLLRRPRRPVRVHTIHAVPEAASLIPLRWRYGRRLKVISYAHGEEVTACESSRQLRFIMRRAHGIVDLMIANSRYTADLVSKHIDPAKVRVVNPGVSIDDFRDAQGAGAALRRQRGWGDRLIVLTVGRLDPRKNHAAVISALAALAREFPEALYVVAGEGRNRATLERLAREAGVGERIEFLGNVDGPLKLALYGACDVFAMPAIRDGTDVEGFGMVFLEAGACAKPVIAGRTGGQSEAVVEGQTALVLDGTDQAQVTAALGRLLGDRDLRQRLGQAGRRHARRFDWPLVVDRIRDLVEKMDADQRGGI